MKWKVLETWEQKTIEICHEKFSPIDLSLNQQADTINGENNDNWMKDLHFKLKQNLFLCK